ncbi:winged helix-turn-helix transcriptional regulator [Patescibacteria group bacterium]|nr:winged helix-turn-helix transcriptional regulator [Patescibacteria group bacterium]
MISPSPSLAFFLHLAKAKTVLARRFDNRLSFHGVGFTEFMILLFLSQSPEEKLRRVDLAEQVGLTASGVTRLLLPMEKIGFIKREATEHDARVSYVALAPGGKRLLIDCMERAEVLSEELLPEPKEKALKGFTELLIELGKTVVY